MSQDFGSTLQDFVHVILTNWKFEQQKTLFRLLEKMATTIEENDVVIVGGGIWGASAALELRNRGHSVTLVEPYVLDVILQFWFNFVAKK
jgi:hypothetical protein